MNGLRIPFLDLASSIQPVATQLTAAWEEVTRHGAFVGGPEVGRFEAEFAAFCDASECVGVANGTDALELVLTALGIGRGDDVIVPANTFIATAEAVSNVGARPVFADVDPETLLIGPDDVKRAVTPATAAVIAVHLYGQPADMVPLAAVAAELGIEIVEDAAQSHGAAYDGSSPAGHSRAATYSFYPGKNLGAFGDGGAVVTNDTDLADAVRRIGAHGRSASDRYLHDVVGRNSRLDTLQAAVLSVRLTRLAEENAHRARVYEWYRERLPASVRLVEQADGRTSSFHLLVASTHDRDGLRARLAEAGVATGLHYPVPCHRQRAFADPTVSMPVSEAAAERILSLPIWGHMTEAQVDEVCEQIRRWRP